MTPIEREIVRGKRHVAAGGSRAFWIKRWRVAIARLESDTAELSRAVAALIVEQHQARQGVATNPHDDGSQP